MVVHPHFITVFLASGTQTLDDRLCRCRERQADRDGWGDVLEVGVFEEGIWMYLVDKMVVEIET